MSISLLILKLLAADFDGDTLNILFLLNQEFIFSDELMVGRSPQSDIIINDNFVSHNHARIYMLNNQYVLEDLGSANGTYLNDVRLDGNTYLQTGDIITIGTVTFEFTR